MMGFKIVLVLYACFHIKYYKFTDPVVKGQSIVVGAVQEEVLGQARR